MTFGIFRSGCVVTFDEDAWRCRNLWKRFPCTRVACPCAYRACAERAGLPVKFGVVVEVGWKRALPVETDGDFIEVPTPQRFRKSRARGCDAPENIGLEGGLRHDVLEASVDSVQVVARECAMYASAIARNNRRSAHAP